MRSKGMRSAAYVLPGMVFIFSLGMAIANVGQRQAVARAESSQSINTIGGCQVFPFNNIGTVVLLLGITGGVIGIKRRNKSKSSP